MSSSVVSGLMPGKVTHLTTNGSRRNPNADFQEQFIGDAHSPPEISFIGKREKSEAELPKVHSVKTGCDKSGIKPPRI